MAFRTFCNNKGCLKEMEPALDKETNQVFCTECDGEITTVDDFMKRQMVSLGQVRKVKIKKSPYSVSCPECKKQGTPKLIGDAAFCLFCEHELNLSGPFIQLLKSVLKKN